MSSPGDHNATTEEVLAGHPKAVMAGGMRIKQAAHHHPVKPANRMGVQEKVEAERTRRASESQSDTEGEKKEKAKAVPHRPDDKPEPRHLDRRPSGGAPIPIQQPR
eukprot:comp21047_c0_seq1/m.28298 comp21047_c0_seq1/g.28298  ORF comp21047_c0_seq1/g.28298 comp21047_c0_seq1/m.28298 type:complete len:106 (-) comp21047_c0_seq1:63-380(-)